MTICDKCRIYREALLEIRERCEDRADADCTGDPPRFQPNVWMQMQMEIDEALAKVDRKGV